MRRGLVVLSLALVFPAAAATQPPVLTLTAPKATEFGRKIDFTGRVVPAQAGAWVRLATGERTVATARTRRDGTFAMKVKIGRPGPFRATWSGTSSQPVTVRIHPKLDVRLRENRLHAVLTPAAAGPLRVVVERNGERTLDARYFGTARVKLAPTYAKIRIRVETIARKGYVPKAEVVRTTIVPPALFVGSASPAVAELARRLRDLGYAVPDLSSTFSYDLQQSVYAFQKVHGLERTGSVDGNFWAKLERPLVPQPRYRAPADHIEVDKAKQVLYVVRDGRVALISPVSTAGIAGYYTPVGTFAIYRKVTGYDPSPLGTLLNPMYFYGGYAIHGNPSVPPYPASHGCIRVPNFVIFRLFASEPYGETVYVY